MILINKVNNAIQITFEGNDKYLHNGVMNIAVNDLILVVDESDMATFKRSSTGDVLFSQLVDNIQISGESVTKDNIIEKFAVIGYGSTGGGVDVDAVGEIVDQKIAESVYTKEEIDNQLGDIDEALDAILNGETTLDYITREQADNLYVAKNEMSVLTQSEYEALGDVVNNDNVLYFITQ